MNDRIIMKIFLLKMAQQELSSLIEKEQKYENILKTCGTATEGKRIYI